MEVALIRDKFDVSSEDHDQMQEEASDSEETPCTSSDTDGEGVGATYAKLAMTLSRCMQPFLYNVGGRPNPRSSFQGI